MPDSDAVKAVAATRVHSVEITDGGTTTAVSMTVAGGGEARLLLPTCAVGDLLFLLAEALASGHGGDPFKARRSRISRMGRMVRERGGHPEVRPGADGPDVRGRPPA